MNLPEHGGTIGPPAVHQTELWCPDGHFNEDQADKVAELCQETRPKYALEIGFCTGRSAAAVLHNTKDFLRHMIAVDQNLDYKAPHGRQMAALLQARFPVFEVIERPSRSVLTPDFFQVNFPEGLDWATIDGEHTYQGCSFDLSAVAPFLNVRGIMVVDDYRSGPPNGFRLESVIRSVDDFLKRHRGEFHAEVWNKRGKGFCVIRRQRTPAMRLDTRQPTKQRE